MREGRMDKAYTPYINILADTVRQLHGAYPHQRIEARIKETEPDGWQCYIEFTEGGATLGSESFFINPPDAGTKADALYRLAGWAERGWIVTLRSVDRKWAVMIETPHAFQIVPPNPGVDAVGLQFNTALHETPEGAIEAAAQVLR